MGTRQGRGKTRKKQGQDRDKILHLEVKKSLVVVVGGWSPSENSVCPRLLLQFPQFMSVWLRQFTSEGRDVELDNNG